MSELRTRADLIRELRATKDTGGLSEEFLRDCGIASIEACAAELRFAGYEVEVQADGGGQEAGPDAGSERRGSRAQARLAAALRPHPGGVRR